MANNAKQTKRYSAQMWDALHYKQTEQYTRAVDALFDAATKKITIVASKTDVDEDKPFSFADYPAVKAVMLDVTKQLAAKVNKTIETGARNEWNYACRKSDAFLSSILNTSKLSKSDLAEMQDRNLEALKAFQGRKVAGLNLSERVWNYVGQYREQMETALDVGLGEGRSAQQLARDVKANLKDPGRLFRRVRDKRGNLVLSKAAKTFHPGQGVYRSSVKNAQRLTRSEINMAYRESDWLRWQQLDFVVGFEVFRSNHEPLCKCDICAQLVGRYPKTFKFIGWHPQCMCYAVPILRDYYSQEASDDRVNRFKAALNGTEYRKYTPKNTVNDVPAGFKSWVKDHIDAQKKWASTPYFIRDNFKNGKLEDGLKIALPKVPEIDPVKQQLDLLQPQIAQARAMAQKWGLILQLSMLNKYVGEKDIASIQSRIATIQDKAMQLQQADADIRRKCAEFGISTHILDEAMKHPDSSNIVTKMAELENMYFAEQKAYNYYISQAGQAIKDAIKYGIDAANVQNDLLKVSGNKREWGIGKTNIKNRLADLIATIQMSIGKNENNNNYDLGDVCQKLDELAVDFNDVHDMQTQLTEFDIIQRVGGGDLTRGSCSSLAFAYAANKAGLDVLDFRDGKSRSYFSSSRNVSEIVKNVGGIIEKGSNDFSTAHKILKNVEAGKEYYFCCGRHAAIIRKTTNGFEYLELQTQNANGFKPLDDKSLKYRFAAQKTHSHYGMKLDSETCLIEISRFVGNATFRKMMGYINTKQKEQIKGEKGTMK